MEKLFCYECLTAKPLRTHHCDICKKCVYVYDHHCSWLNNCIGSFNHKYFILFLFFINVQLISTIAMNILVVIEYVLDKKNHYIYNSDTDSIYSYVTGCLIGFTLVDVFAFLQVFALLLRQSFSISKGLTAIEEEKFKLEANFNQVSETNAYP